MWPKPKRKYAAINSSGDLKLWSKPKMNSDYQLSPTEIETETVCCQYYSDIGQPLTIDSTPLSAELL